MRDPQASDWGRLREGSIERRMLILLGEHLGVPLRPRALTLTAGSRVEVEGMSADDSVIVQLVANQGSYKPSYRNKALADMLKLTWVRSQTPAVRRTVLMLTQDVLPAVGGWVSVAASDLNIELFVFSGDGVSAHRPEQ